MRSLLWSVAVIAEVVVFVGIGPWVLRVFQPATAISLAALAGAIRWGIAASTADPVVLTLLQLLHGLTFALLHLACMRLLAGCVPPRLSETAQAIYGTLAVGIASASLTVASRWLYARLDQQAFAVMSLLCLAVLPSVSGFARVPANLYCCTAPLYGNEHLTRLRQPPPQIMRRGGDEGLERYAQPVGRLSKAL